VATTLFEEMIQANQFGNCEQPTRVDTAQWHYTAAITSRRENWLLLTFAILSLLAVIKAGSSYG
jgi:hypothetical protein